MTDRPRKADLHRGQGAKELPCYSVPYAASLVGVPVSTLRSWVLGRSYLVKGGKKQTVRVIHASDPGYLSFTNLIEAHALASMRREYQLKLDKIRKAVRFVERELDVPHPLAQLQFKTDGVELFVDHLGHLLNVSQAGQYAIRDAFGERLERVEYERGWAARLFPLVRTSSGEQPRLVVIDPELGFGRPVLTGTGVPVSIIQERFKGGDSTGALAEDYGVGVEAIEEALRAA